MRRDEGQGVALRVVEYEETEPPTPPHAATPPTPASRPNPGLVAARLISALADAETDLVYVALSETTATRIASAVRSLNPDAYVVVLPPWDRLPYDRVPPSRQCMGRRMDALRVWAQPSSRPKLLITSLDAMLQRVPPSAVVEDSWYRLAVGEGFDRAAFADFAGRTGYVEDGMVDEPGELAFREDVIDIFPAGGLAPMRIVVGEDGTVSELRCYDPATQRTEYTLEEMIFGPACEAVLTQDDLARGKPVSEAIERRLFQLYGDLQTVFDMLGAARVAFAEGTGDRLESYLEIIEEARQAHRDFSGSLWDRPLYLDRSEWDEKVDAVSSFSLDLDGAETLPSFWKDVNPRKAFMDYTKAQTASGRRVLLTGRGALFAALCRRLERGDESDVRPVARWSDVEATAPGAVVKLACDLEQGFVDRARKLVVITCADVLGEAAVSTSRTTVLAEPELRPGDVVVHEDHGVAMLSGLESVVTDGVTCDAARLEYHGGASLLVTMDEFGKLWRYGSEADSVTFDRLHTDGWAKKRATVAKDIRAAARHLLRLARQREETAAAVIVPPRADYAKFVSHFPYVETLDQQAAIEAVAADLSSGKVMNRLVCGDVGFGKTEIALRAAAAVALAGGQVVVVAPTTVLARQHFTTFQRRFSGTRVSVAMLSRVVSAGEAKRVKAGLASGEIGIVVATQAVLAKNVSFAALQLLIIDEEHRFGARDKAKMQALAPLLHTLIMSATPIPRTLQAAMIGVQDVSLLTTAPSKRHPVRTFLSAFDRASARVALLREHRRGGQSFFVAPQIEDLDALEAVLEEIAPELSVRVAHGRMPAADMDEIMVGFADGDGDVLLSTNIIESGLDIPRANTMLVWRADRFGLAQLHQLRGRVGRSQAQGSIHLLTAPGEDIPDDTRLRLSTLLEYDRMGAGLQISIQDLDLRGGGEIAGESQAGHMKVLGIGLYQKLLERAVSSLRKVTADGANSVALNLGIAGSIPADYVNDATMRLNFYARLLRAGSHMAIDGLAEEFEDRFGDLPDEVAILLRLAKLKVDAAACGISRLDGGPRALAIGFAGKPTRKIIALLSRGHAPVQRDGRLIYERPSATGLERLRIFEALLKQ